MKDFVMWSAPSLEVLRDVEFYYVHKDRDRLQRALDELVTLNGKDNAPLLSFMKAAGLIEAEFDVRASGARGPGSVNCLWADFYATGDRAPILALIAALPSWYAMKRQMQAKGIDPAQSVIEGAGHSVNWSLRPHLVRHGKLRAICKQEAASIDQPLQAREELLQALAEVARHRCEGDEIAEPRTIAKQEYDSPPDLQWLDQEPTHTWIPQLMQKYPTLESVEAAIVAAEANEHMRDAGLLCVLLGYYSLAARHLAPVKELPPIPRIELGMAIFHEALALARAGRFTASAFENAIAIFELQPEQVQWVGGSLEARVQRALCSRDPNDAKEALARIEQAATGPFADKFDTLVKWARQNLAPTS